jgi:hypothetical protein
MTRLTLRGVFTQFYLAPPKRRRRELLLGREVAALESRRLLSAAPTIGNLGPTLVYAFGAAPASVAPYATLAFDAADAGPLLAVQLTNGGGSDRLSLLGGNGLTVSGPAILFNGNQIGAFVTGGGLSTGTAPLNMQFNSLATPAMVQIALRQVAFSNVSATPGQFDRNLTVQLTDGNGAASGAATKTVQALPAPTIGNLGPTTEFTVFSAPVPIAPQAAVTGANAHFYNSTLRVRMLNGVNQIQLTIANGQGVSSSGGALYYKNEMIGVWDVGFGKTPLTIYFRENVTRQAVEAVVRQAAFLAIDVVPSVTPRQIEFQLTTNSGFATTPVSKTVQVSDAPRFYDGFLGPVFYRVGNTPMPVGGGLILGDGGGNFANSVLALQLVDGQAGDHLKVFEGAGLTVNGATLLFNGVPVAQISGGNGAQPLKFQFNAQGTREAISAVLQLAVYENLKSSPSLAQRTLTFQFTDGHGLPSNTLSKPVYLKNNLTISTPDPVAPYVAGGKPLLISSAANVTGGVDYFPGSALVVQPYKFGPGDRLTLVPGGAVAVEGNQVLYNGAVVGEWNFIDVVAPLKVQFNDSATPASIRAVLRRVAFYSGGTAPGTFTRTFGLSLLDRNGIAGNYAVQSASVSSQPAIVGLGATVNCVAGKPPARMASDATLIEPGSQFTNSVLSVQLANGANADQLQILTGSRITSAGTDLFVDGVLIGSVTGGSGKTPLQITFNFNGTQGRIQLVLRNIAFSSAANAPVGNRKATFQFTDGGGNVSGVATQSINVSAALA